MKSGNSRANSLNSILIKNKEITYGCKFVDGNIGCDETGVITLPLYMASFI